MKKLLLIALSPVLLFSSSYAATGGPDAYGYIWKDSNEPGGPTYQWFDISVIGNPVTGLGDDNIIGPKPLGGNFQFYWYQVDKCWIGSNGYLTFMSNGQLASPFPTIPNSAGVNNYIAAFAADLNFLGTPNNGQCFYYFNQDTFCLSFVNVPYWNTPNNTGSNSFQIILNRADSTITLNYQTMQGPSYNGNSCIGIENVTGQIGLMHSYNTVPANNYSIRYYAPANPSLQVTDGSAEWNTSTSNTGMFLKQNGPAFQLVSNVKNQGNQVIPPFQVDGQILNLSNTVIVANTTFTDTLNPAQDTTITFSNNYPTNTAGTFQFRTYLSNILNDVSQLNDTNIQEIVVIDTTQTTIGLDYNNNFTNPYTSSISWTGGYGGAGIFIKPPTYPVRVVSTKFVVLSNGTGPAFYAKIYDDNGPGGAPGSLLDSVAVPITSVTLGGTTTVPVSSNIVIASGGFYVLWDMANGGSIATDWDPPFSLNTYEVFANIWSDYRDKFTQDFLIGANVVKTVPEDVGVNRIVTPTNMQTISAPVTVSCYIKNYGTQPDNYFINVNYKLGLSGNPTTEAYTGSPIPPGDSVLFTFATQLTPPYSANDVLCCWTSKSTDVLNTNDTTCINVILIGVDELKGPLADLSVYPNPAGETITVDLSVNAEMKLYNLLGEEVGSVKLNTGQNQIDISTLSEGIYTYKIISGKYFTSGKISKM